MEDVWCGEWSRQHCCNGAVSLESCKGRINLKLSKEKAFEIRAEGTCVG
jgi:hypothetical protein